MTKKEVKIERRNLNPQELKEIVKMTEFVNGEIWKQDLIARNTALIKNGKEVAKQLEDINKVLASARQTFTSNLLVNCGVPVGIPVNFNLETGEIKEAEVEKKLKK